MLTKKQAESTLKIIFSINMELFNKIDYRIVGTSSSLLQGVNLPCNDIDILVKDRKAVDKFSANMCTYQINKNPYFINYNNGGQYICEIGVNGVIVEMSTCEWETPSEYVETYGVGPWKYFTKVNFDSYEIFGVKNELRLLTELARNRQDRIGPLVQFLINNGANFDLLKSGMVALNIPNEKILEIEALFNHLTNF